MLNFSEIFDFLVSSLLVIYLIVLIRRSTDYIKTYWFWGIAAILFSKLSTILESFIFSSGFNIAEHLSFTIGCILLLIGIIKREL